jgi:excisionase family DNA binding protein
MNVMKGNNKTDTKPAADTLEHRTIARAEICSASAAGDKRLAYSVQEAADMLGVNYFSVYRLIQRGKLKVCRALRGKLLIPRLELLKLLEVEQ